MIKLSDKEVKQLKTAVNDIIEREKEAFLLAVKSMNDKKEAMVKVYDFLPNDSKDSVKEEYDNFMETFKHSISEATKNCAIQIDKWNKIMKILEKEDKK